LDGEKWRVDLNSKESIYMLGRITVNEVSSSTDSDIHWLEEKREH
jgi:hypothetical protein